MSDGEFILLSLAIVAIFTFVQWLIEKYEYCMNGGSYDSDGIWKPDKNGLGMKHVIDTLNSLYGEEFIKY